MEESIKKYAHYLQNWARIYKDGLPGVSKDRTRKILSYHYFPPWSHPIEREVQQELHRRYRDDHTALLKVGNLGPTLMFDPKTKKYAKN